MHLWHKFTSLFYFQSNFFTTKCISSFFPYLIVHIYNLILFYYMHLLSVFRVVHKNDVLFAFTHSFLGGLMSYLFYLRLLPHSRVQHVFNVWVTWRCLIRDRNCLPLASTWVHRRFFVSSCCSSFLVFCVVFLFWLSSSCVLCTKCYRCLWTVHSWLPLRFL